MRPRREPLAVGQSGVQRGHAARQPRAKAGEELRGESDLGNEHERLAPSGDHRLDEPQVHLGLAAAGDAVEHEGAEFPEVRLHRFHRTALLGVEDRAIGTVEAVGKVGPATLLGVQNRAIGIAGPMESRGLATLPVVQDPAIGTASLIGPRGFATLLGVQDRAIGTVGRIGTVGPKWQVGDGLRPAFRDERPQRPAPVAVRGRELRIRDAPGVEHQAEQTALDGRASDPLGERLRSGGGGRVPHRPLGPGRPPEPQQPWQRADDDLADGVLEVSARPEEQLQHRRCRAAAPCR